MIGESQNRGSRNENIGLLFSVTITLIYTLGCCAREEHLPISQREIGDQCAAPI